MPFFSGLSRKADLENKQAILRLLRPMPDARVLEVGPGEENLAVPAGKLLKTTELFGIEYTGCGDPPRKAGLNTTECDLNNESWPFPDSSFDVIIGNQVLEHIANTDHFIKEIRRLLTDRGYAILSVPNLGSLSNIAMLTLSFQPNHCHLSDEYRGLGNPLSGQRFVKWTAKTRLHLRMFTIRGMADLCRAHGLHVEKIHGGSYGVPLVSRLMASLDPWHSVYCNVRFRKAKAGEMVGGANGHVA